MGQHFLTGQWAARALAHAVGVRSGETILEVGPGKGALTKELLKLASVVAIEKDPVLVEKLKQAFATDVEMGRLRIVLDDIRNSSPDALGIGQYVVAANIPYYITGEIIRQFLTAPRQPRAMALLVQKEVAERIMARPGRSGDGKESILSLSVKVFGTPRVVAKVSRGNFSPPPNVDSAILLIDDISRGQFSDMDENMFFRVVKTGFSSKRKLLASNLGALCAKETIAAAFTTCGIPEKSRAEDVPIEQWVRLARTLRA